MKREVNSLPCTRKLLILPNSERVTGGVSSLQHYELFLLYGVYRLGGGRGFSCAVCFRSLLFKRTFGWERIRFPEITSTALFQDRNQQELKCDPDGIINKESVAGYLRRIVHSRFLTPNYPYSPCLAKRTPRLLDTKNSK